MDYIMSKTVVSFFYVEKMNKALFLHVFLSRNESGVSYAIFTYTWKWASRIFYWSSFKF